MAGLSKDTPNPTEIKLHRKSGLLEIGFDDGKAFRLPCEFLRVYSPSAEVRGHSPGQEILQVGKKNVSINHIEPVGNYAIQLNFSDGHNTGLYSWDLLYDYGLHQEKMWQRYLDRMEEAGASREPVAYSHGSNPRSASKSP
ncbi:MAG: gamma-butyrobetaine hydroxylase-like domain-containing protein [Nitrosospira sp.]